MYTETPALRKTHNISKIAPYPPHKKYHIISLLLIDKLLKIYIMISLGRLLIWEKVPLYICYMQNWDDIQYKLI